MCYILGASYDKGIYTIYRCSLAGFFGSGLLGHLLNLFDGFLDVLNSLLASLCLQDLLEDFDSGLSGVGSLEELDDNLLGGALMFVRVVLLNNPDYLMRSNDGSGVMDLLNMSNLSNDPDMSFHHLVEGLDDVRVVGETVSLHNME